MNPAANASRADWARKNWSRSDHICSMEKSVPPRGRMKCLPLVKEMGKAIELASICGLGPIRSGAADDSRQHFFEDDVNKASVGKRARHRPNEK